MSQPTPPRPSGPKINLRGAVDLSGLAKPAPPAGGAPAGGAAPGNVLEVTEAAFPQVVQQSTQVPVLLALVSSASPASQGVVDTLAKLAGEYGGRFLLGRVDIDTATQIAAAFQVQGVPTVVAVLGGQPVPLFEGPASEAQIRSVIDQVLAVAQQNGITGTVPDQPAAPDQDAPAEDGQQPASTMPPHLADAEEALMAGDLDGAIAAFETAIKNNPGDALAKNGLTRARFLARVQGHDPATVRHAAAADPKDVDAQLAAADLELYGGNVADAFNRLIDTVRVTAGPERETIRARLVDLFDVVGGDDPAVVSARRALAMALF